MRRASPPTAPSTKPTPRSALRALHLAGAHPDLDAMLGRIQNDLFDLGADLCAPERDDAKPKRERLRVSEAQVKRLEDEIDAMNAELTPLRSFVLPGGSPAAAALHVARTVCRRAERAIVELAGEPDEPVSAPALKYINRLSDLLFVASRYVNDLGEEGRALGARPEPLGHARSASFKPSFKDIGTWSSFRSRTTIPCGRSASSGSPSA